MKMNFLTAFVMTAFLCCTGIVSRALPVSRSGETLNPTLQSLTSHGDETCTLHIRDHSSLRHPSNLKVKAVCEPRDKCQVVTRMESPDDNTYTFTCVRRNEFSSDTDVYATHLPQNEVLTTRTRPSVQRTNKAISANQRMETSLPSRPSYIRDNLASLTTETPEEEEPRPSINVVNKGQEQAEGIHTEFSSDESKSIVRRSRPSDIVPNGAVNEDSGAPASSEERFSERVTNRAESEQDSNQQPERERPVEGVRNQAQSSGASRRSAHYRPTEEVRNRAQGQHRQNVETRRPSVRVQNRAQSHQRGHKGPGHKAANRRPSVDRPNLADRRH